MIITDPRAYFLDLVKGTDSNRFWETLDRIEPNLFAAGIGQQRPTGGGNPRGRLFLPHAGARNCAAPPGSPRGVSDSPAAWEHAVDVLDGEPGSLRWAWNDRGGPAYVPFDSGVEPPPPPPPPSEPTDLVAVHEKLNEILALLRHQEHYRGKASARGITADIELHAEG